MADNCLQRDVNGGKIVRKRRAKQKQEPTTDVQLSIAAIDYPNGGPLRFREKMAEAELEDGTKIELAVCSSGSHLYFLRSGDQPRQVAISLNEVMSAVVEHWAYDES